MTEPKDLVLRAHESLAGWLACGHETRTHATARLVCNMRMPDVYDANFVYEVRARASDEIESLLETVDSVYRDLDHRQYLWDPGMPQEFEARLQLDGFTAFDLVVQVLEGPRRARQPQCELRPVLTDDDWEVVLRLESENHAEEVAKGFHEEWGDAVTRQLVESKRVKAPAVQYWLASVDGEDCAYFSAWPGNNGVGQVEDLFTAERFRGRGIGNTLIATCIDDARSRGAGPLLISARTNDTPKDLYTALGFRPLCIERRYVKTGLTQLADK